MTCSFTVSGIWCHAPVLFQGCCFYCFRDVVFTVSGMLYLLFQGCGFYCFRDVVFTVSGMLFLLFQGCSVTGSFTVSGMLFLLFQGCCFYCFRDVVKLTAQFVARNGRQFLSNLMSREKNYQFDFLRPQHSLFNYFTKLVEQYTKVCTDFITPKFF